MYGKSLKESIICTQQVASTPKKQVSLGLSNIYPKDEKECQPQTMTRGTECLKAELNTPKITGAQFTDYNCLENKPTINGMTIIGDVTVPIFNPDLSILTNVNAKEMSILEQNSALLYVYNNGQQSKMNLNDLDYSKVTVLNSGDSLNNVRTNDFIFEKENN